jgi:glycosyltransferase involved in cell wall biosynthesis
MLRTEVASLKDNESHKLEIIIATNNGDIGGGEVMLLNLATALESSGHRVKVLAPTNPSELASVAGSRGHHVIELKCESRLDWVMAIRKWRKANPEGLLWCNGLLPAFATALMPNRIVHLHQIPVGLLKPAAWVAKFRSAGVFVPSGFMRNVIKRSTVLPNWVSKPVVDATGTWDTIRVGFIGRLATIKGIDVLCRAVSLADPSKSKLQLVVAGLPRFTDTKDSQVVSRALESLGDQVTFLGWVKPEDFLGQVDVVCSPSVWQEPFGLVVAEAMAARKPIIASRVGGIPEILGEDYPFLVQPSDEAMLASALSQVALNIKSNDPSVNALAARMYDRWQERFSPEAGKKNLDDLLSKIR